MGFEQALGEGVELAHLGPQAHVALHQHDVAQDVAGLAATSAW